MNGIKAPKYIPAEVMRKLTEPQLRIILTQKNSKGRYSQNADRAAKILRQRSGYTTFTTGTVHPPTLHERTGWDIPEEKTIELEPWLNGTENLKASEYKREDSKFSRY